MLPKKSLTVSTTLVRSTWVTKSISTLGRFLVRISGKKRVVLNCICLYIDRAHKDNDGNVEFYSILTEGTAIWSREEPLKYFID